MSVENDLYADLCAILADTLPDITAIYERAHVERLSWEALNPDYVVIDIGDFPESEWSVDSLDYEPEVHIYLVVAAQGPLDTLREQLSALRRALLTAEPEHTQITEVYGLSTSHPDSADEVLAGKRMAHQAGRISCKCLIADEDEI